jgi:DNA-directed RNA polymerase
VDENKDMILSVARDPKHDLRWTQASEPWQFLRFCFEWQEFKRHGYGFVSHMVTAVDATCSGLQHYSMALRDEVGGRSVNLVPGLPRQDIYADVAQKVVEKLFEASSHSPVECANILRLGVDRKMTKRQVMVVPYAGTFASCMTYTREAVKDKLKEGHAPTWDVSDRDEDARHVVLLSKLIWESIDEVVIKGKEAMRWLSNAARAYTEWANANVAGEAYDKRMSWLTPDGFEAIHYRADLSKSMVETYLDGRLRLTLYAETPKLSSQDMALAVAPNWVHSLDAALLRESINRGLALEAPIVSYAMVHDSFGVHAARMPDFLRLCIKPAFVEMYRTDVLREFAERLPPNLALDPLPEQGSLNPNGVLDSEFFFS